MKLLNLKLDFSTSDISYKFCVYMLKASGFVFFSIKSLENGSFKFYQVISDYIIFCVSFSFSLFMALDGVHQGLTVNIQSIALSVGTAFLWKVSMISIIITKLINIIGARRAFSMLADTQWIDQKVCDNNTCSEIIFSRLIF